MATSQDNPETDPPGFEFLGTYFDISTLAEYNGSIQICFKYPHDYYLPEGINEEELQIMHWVEYYDQNELVAEWRDITDRNYPDTVNNIICGTVYSLSWFGIALPVTVANAGMDRIVECTGETATPVQLDGSASYDPEGDPLTFTWTWDGGSATGETPTIYLPLGTHTIRLVVNDGEADSEPDEVTIAVVDETPPQLVPPSDVVAECQESEGQRVEIGEAAATDVCCGVVNIVNDAPPKFSTGDTDVMWTASDCNGNSSSATQKISVVDTTPPMMNVSVTPEILWPPKHRMVPATVEVQSSDACDATPLCRIESVTSNEPVNGLGDGDQTPDWEITGDLTVKLRAERSGKGSGRVYMIIVECTDSSGNSSTETVNVTVPHNK